MRNRLFVAVTLLCLSWAGVTLAQNAINNSPQSTKAKPTASKQNAASEGERLFTVNCSRCHNPPESISPREAAAVVRHMRVRAMLSTKDEKQILQFIAP